MRNKFADTVYEIGLINQNISLVVADISPAGSIEKFRQKFPKRFVNCGVAEQSMIVIAAGMAMRGMRPFCYTIATFALYRLFEMIRVDLAYQNLPVTVIGMGAGIIYSTLGGTHHTMEDIAVASSIPNMTVLAPCDPNELKLATEWCASKSKGPVYMRIGKAGEPDITSSALDKFEIGKLRYLKKGKDIAIISYGVTVSLALKISRELDKKGKSTSVISCHSIKPIDLKGIKNMMKNHKQIIVIEEHVSHGGLSSRVKEIGFDNKYINPINCFTLKDQFIHFYGSRDQFLEVHGLSEKIILKKLTKQK